LGGDQKQDCYVSLLAFANQFLGDIQIGAKQTGPKEEELKTQVVRNVVIKVGKSGLTRPM
jgi:hypothetical protein